jgi:hypothetical protein
MDNPARYQHDKLIRKLAAQYKQPYNVVKAIVESQFEFANETTKKIDLHSVQNEEELLNLKTNFNFKYLFSLYIKWSKLKHIKNKGGK